MKVNSNDQKWLKQVKGFPTAKAGGFYALLL